MTKTQIAGLTGDFTVIGQDPVFHNGNPWTMVDEYDDHEVGHIGTTEVYRCKLCGRFFRVQYPTRKRTNRVQYARLGAWNNMQKHLKACRAKHAEVPGE